MEKKKQPRKNPEKYEGALKKNRREKEKWKEK